MQTHVLCTCSQALHADTCPLYMEPSTTCRHMSPVHAAKHYMQTHVPCTCSQALHADTCPLYMQPSTTCRHMSPVHAAKHYMQTHVPCTWSLSMQQLITLCTAVPFDTQMYVDIRRDSDYDSVEQNVCIKRTHLLTSKNHSNYTGYSSHLYSTCRANANPKYRSHPHVEQIYCTHSLELVMVVDCRSHPV